MTTFGNDLIGSLNEALHHAKGKKAGMREHAIEVPDTRAAQNTGSDAIAT